MQVDNAVRVALFGEMVHFLIVVVFFMTRTGALIFSLTIVLLGVALRAAPHMDRAVQVWTADQHASAPVAMPSGSPEKPLTAAATGGIPARLSQRPVGLLLIGLAVEALLIGSMLYVGARSQSIAATFGVLAVRYQVVTVGLLTFLVVGLIGGSDQTFPFVPWRMYSGASTGGLQIYELVGTSYSGNAVRLDLDQVLPVLGSRRLHHTLTEQSTSIQEETQLSQRETLWARHQATLQAIGRLYNRKHAESPIHRIAVWAVTVSGDDSQTQPAINRHELWSITVD